MTQPRMSLAEAQAHHAKNLAQMRYWLLGAKFYTAVAAMEFSAEHHTGLRKDGVTPEFAHQIYLARYVRTVLPGLMFPEQTLATVFLHDLVEDYAAEVPIEEVERRFGKVIADSTWRLTKVRDGRKLPDAIYYEGMVADPIASLVKGADRSHNIFTMNAAGWTAPKQLAYLDEADQFLLPMLKQARRRFPQQEPAYENVKTMLALQTTHIRLHLAALLGNEPDASAMSSPGGRR